MPDLPGYGESEGIEPALRVQDHLDWVEELLDQLKLTQVHVAGLDLGGLLAAGLCLRGRAKHVALTSTAIGPGWFAAWATALPGPHLFFYKFYGGRRWLQQGVHPDSAEALLALHSPRLESDPGFVERMQNTALAFSFGAKTTDSFPPGWPGESPPTWTVRSTGSLAGGTTCPLVMRRPGAKP